MRKIIKKYQTPGDSLPAAPGFNNQLDPALVVANSSWNPNLLKEMADQKALESLNASVVDAGIKFNRTNTTDSTDKNNGGAFGDKDAGTTGNGDLDLEALKKKKSFEGKLSNTSRAISGLTDIASSFIDVDENSSFKQQQMVGDALLQSGNPYAMAAGAAFKGLSAMDQALGINTNTINKNEANVAGISKGERILNNVLGFLPGTGAGLLAGKTDSFNFNEDLLKVGSSYGKSISDMQTMEGMSEGRYLFGKKKINDKMAELEEDQSILASALKRCDLFITNHCGPMYVGVSQDVPVVALYGSSSRKIYGPYTDNAVIVTANPPCMGCAGKMKHKCDNMQCMERLTVEQVLEAADKMLTLHEAQWLLQRQYLKRL